MAVLGIQSSSYFVDAALWEYSLFTHQRSCNLTNADDLFGDSIVFTTRIPAGLYGHFSCARN